MDDVRAMAWSGLQVPGLRIFTLGRFRVERDDAVLLREGGRARKASALFKYLLTHQERAVPAADVLALLWPETPEESAATNLRSLLYQLRQLLGSPARGASCLSHTGATLALRLTSDDWWDVAAFEAWLAEGALRLRAGEIESALVAYRNRASVSFSTKRSSNGRQPRHQADWYSWVLSGGAGQEPKGAGSRV
jgi:DNA-binding SARP family transcriptional activator